VTWRGVQRQVRVLCPRGASVTDAVTSRRVAHRVDPTAAHLWPERIASGATDKPSWARLRLGGGGTVSCRSRSPSRMRCCRPGVTLLSHGNSRLDMVPRSVTRHERISGRAMPARRGYAGSTRLRRLDAATPARQGYAGSTRRRITLKRSRSSTRTNPCASNNDRGPRQLSWSTFS
jgi:hypothetical protein